jgi:hypothetical protein
MSKAAKLESLKYFESVSRWQKGLVCLVVFFVFWLTNQIIFSLKFTWIEQLSIGILFPIAIFCTFFLGYKRSFQIDSGDNFINIQCDLSKLIILLNRCGFDLQEQVGDYYLLKNRFRVECHKKLTVTGVSGKCIVFGNVHLLKMLNADLVTLKTIYTTKET